MFLPDPAALPAGAPARGRAGCGVQARKALAAAAAVPVAAAELGKASTSSDNSKASRTTSAMLPAAARTADSLLPTPDVKPCAPASEASKADSGGSDGGGRGAGGSGSGPGSGLGSDSDGEGRSARSSRDVVRPAGARGSRGEGEGDSSERGGRRVSDSAEGGAGAAGCAGASGALVQGALFGALHVTCTVWSRATLDSAWRRSKAGRWCPWVCCLFKVCSSSRHAYALNDV